MKHSLTINVTKKPVYVFEGRSADTRSRSTPHPSAFRGRNPRKGKSYVALSVLPYEDTSQYR